MRHHLSTGYLSFFLLQSLFLSSPLNILCIFCCLCGIPMCVFASSASPMEFITRGLARPGLQQHSLLLSHDVNSARPSGYLGLLDCVCVSVFLGWGSRQDEHNTKPLGIRKIVPGMPGIPSGNLAVWHRGWIWVQCVCVCLKQCECESESYSNYLPLSLFLLRPEPAVSTHETRIMGQLFGEAYYGMRTQHISLPHSQTHTQTHS